MRIYRFRLYPSKKIEKILNKHLELCRFVYNKLLEILKEKEKEKIKPFDLAKTLPSLKEKYPELKQVYSKVLQMVNQQLWGNILALYKRKQKGRRIGKLRYKGKNRWKILNYNQSGFKIIKTGKRLDLLKLSKIGEIPIRISREIDGKVKGIIIRKYPSGKWYALVQIEELSKLLPKTGKAIGIDVGIKYFLTDSEGRRIENPKFYQSTLNRIKTIQKQLSRKKRGSKNWEKWRRKLAKLYEKLTNQRDDFLHKLSRFYVNNYDIIVVEKLKITKMIKNNFLAGRILDASWGKFFQFLSYKAEGAGKVVLEVDPRGTSKGLTWEQEDRDYISANRILYRELGQPCPPVERRPLSLITADAVVRGQVSSMKQEALSGSPTKLFTYFLPLWYNNKWKKSQG